MFEVVLLEKICCSAARLNQRLIRSESSLMNANSLFSDDVGKQMHHRSFLPNTQCTETIKSKYVFYF